MNNTQKVTCAYCNCDLWYGKLESHQDACIRNPAVESRLIAALTSDTPGVGVSCENYRLTYREKNAPAPATLNRHFGNAWGDVLAAFGLKVPARTYVRRQDARTAVERQAEQDMDAWRNQMREVVRSERYHLYGFTVCRITPEPGLRINGRECVRMELR